MKSDPASSSSSPTGPLGRLRDRIIGLLHRHSSQGMLSRKYPLLTELWQFFDILAVLLALVLVAEWSHGYFGLKHALVGAITSLVMLLVYAWTDLYYRVRTRSVLMDAQYLMRAWGLVFLILLTTGYLLQFHPHFPTGFAIAWFFTGYLFQLALHVLVRAVLNELRKHGLNIRRALLVGTGEPLQRFCRLLESNPWLGIQVVGYVSDPAWERTPVPSAGQGEGSKLMAVGAGGESPLLEGVALFQQEECMPELLGRPEDLEQIIQEHEIGEIYITFPVSHSEPAERIIRRAINLPVNVNWVPDTSVVEALSRRTESIEDQPLVCLTDSPFRGGRRTLKRLEDITLATLALGLLWPLMLGIAIAVKVTSPGPIIFRQQRHGLHGRTISVWKFRTMRVQPEGEAKRQASPDDERITPIGRFLRRWSLDELPQIINVLQGRMSMVGPRPHPLWLDEYFGAEIDAYMQRHRVKPGITGWAQVHGLRGETDTVEKMERRLQYDLYYINHWSPWLDFKILFLTVFAVFRGTNAY